MVDREETVSRVLVWDIRCYMCVCVCVCLLCLCVGVLDVCVCIACMRVCAHVVVMFLNWKENRKYSKFSCGVMVSKICNLIYVWSQSGVTVIMHVDMHSTLHTHFWISHAIFSDLFSFFPPQSFYCWVGFINYWDIVGFFLHILVLGCCWVFVSPLSSTVWDVSTNQSDNVVY